MLVHLRNIWVHYCVLKEEKSIHLIRIFVLSRAVHKWCRIELQANISRKYISPFTNIVILEFSALQYFKSLEICKISAIFFSIFFLKRHTFVLLFLKSIYITYKGFSSKFMETCGFVYITFSESAFETFSSCIVDFLQKF